MKRLLFVYHVSKIGGGSYCLLNLLKAVDRTVFIPVVLLPRKGPLSEEINKLGIEIVYYPHLTLYPYNKSLLTIGTIRKLFNMVKCFRGFSKLVRQIKPDIVYLNTMMLFPFARFAKKEGCTTVIHVREHWPLNEHTKQLMWARNEVDKYVDKLVAINCYSASIFPHKKATVIYDWIDMDERRGGPTLNEVLGIDDSNIKAFLFTGGIDPIKGTMEVVSTFSKFVKGNDKRLIAMGIDKTIFFPGIKGKIKKALSLMGLKSYKEKVIALCNKDPRIVCVPAIYNITNIMEKTCAFLSFFKMPHANLALAESIIMGIPSIAAQTDESLEYSNKGELAILFEFGNISLFEESVKGFENRSNKLQVKLRDGSAIIAEKFSRKRNAIIFDKTLKSLIS